MHDKRMLYVPTLGKVVHAALLVIAKKALGISDGLRLCIVLWVCVKSHTVVANYMTFRMGGGVALMILLASGVEAVIVGYLMRSLLPG